MTAAAHATQYLPHILVVDDEPDNRRLLNRILARMAKITEVGDGQSALDFLAREAFDLVLLDIMMPGLTAFRCWRLFAANRILSICRWC